MRYNATGVTTDICDLVSEEVDYRDASAASRLNNCIDIKMIMWNVYYMKMMMWNVYYIKMMMWNVYYIACVSLRWKKSIAGAVDLVVKQGRMKFVRSGQVTSWCLSSNSPCPIFFPIFSPDRVTLLLF